MRRTFALWWRYVPGQAPSISSPFVIHEHISQMGPSLMVTGLHQDWVEGPSWMVIERAQGPISQNCTVALLTAKFINFIELLIQKTNWTALGWGIFGHCLSSSVLMFFHSGVPIVHLTCARKLHQQMLCVRRFFKSKYRTLPYSPRNPNS